MLIENKARPKLLSDIGFYNLVRPLHIRLMDFIFKREYKKMIKNGYRIEPPERFVLEPTSRCNLNCKMCFIKKAGAKLAEKEVYLKGFKKAMENAPSMKYAAITGGEMFARQDIFDILSFLGEKGIKVLLTTNGTLIHKGNIKRLRENENIVSIVFSVDGKKETHNSIRGWDKAYQRTMDAINLTKDKYFVTVVCVPQKDNLNELSDVVEMAKAKGLKSVIFEYERKYTKEAIDEAKSVLVLKSEHLPLAVSKSDKPGFSFDELRRGLETVEDAARGTGVKVYYLPNVLKSRMRMCYDRAQRKNGRYFCRLMFKPRIDAEGNVIHCYAIRKPMGNLLKKTFGEIWNSGEYIRFRKKLLSNNLLPICENCLYMQKI